MIFRQGLLNYEAGVFFQQRGWSYRSDTGAGRWAKRSSGKGLHGCGMSRQILWPRLQSGNPRRNGNRFFNLKRDANQLR